jgi:adenosine kinase
VVTATEPDAPKIYPVNKLDTIVDTNGAGDAFAGGYLGAHILGKSLEESILAGHKLAAVCVQQVKYSQLFDANLCLIQVC